MQNSAGSDISSPKSSDSIQQKKKRRGADGLAFAVDAQHSFDSIRANITFFHREFHLCYDQRWMKLVGAIG
jgi:hypothetical protein